MSTDTLDALYGSMYGALFFSTVMSTGFYGVTCMQIFFYYVHYPNDPLRMKSFVAAVWAFNTIHQALAISGTYKYIMAGLINPLSISTVIPEIILQSVFTVLVAVVTQGFFVYRIYALERKNIVAPLIWAPLAIYQLVSTFIYVAKSLYSANGVHAIGFLVLGDRFFMDIATSSLSVAAGVDILIAGFLTFLLVRKRTATGNSGTAHVLQRLTVFAINTGIWTAALALLTVIMLQLYPSNFLNVVFCIPLCSVYCNTLLANLNARTYIRGEMMTHNVDLSAQSLQVSGGCKTDQRRGETESIQMSVQHLEDHGGAKFFDANRSTESDYV